MRNPLIALFLHIIFLFIILSLIYRNVNGLFKEFALIQALAYILLEGNKILDQLLIWDNIEEFAR